MQVLKQGDRTASSRGGILMVSLVNHVPTLAGLTHTFKFFRAAAMVDFEQAGHRGFWHADQGLPPTEAAEPNLVQCMLQKRAEGLLLN